MGPHVIRQVGQLFKTSPAFLALVWFLACVRFKYKQLIYRHLFYIFIVIYRRLLSSVVIKCSYRPFPLNVSNVMPSRLQLFDCGLVCACNVIIWNRPNTCTSFNVTACWQKSHFTVFFPTFSLCHFFSSVFSFLFL